MLDRNNGKDCPCCFGTGVQTGKDGMRHPCPHCDGGKIREKPYRPGWQS